jgi:hypothetical protein
MTYKIAAQINGHWTDDAVGQPNKFESAAEAYEMIPILATIFDCSVNEFRAQECEA